MAVQSLVGDVRQLRRELVSVWRISGTATWAEWATNLVKEAPRIARSRTLGSADRAMRKSWYSFSTGTGCLRLPGSAFGLAREIIGRRIYEPDERFRIRPGDNVLDLGSNIGVYGLLAASQGAHVVAVEAQQQFVHELRLNAAANSISGIRAVHGVLAPSGGLLSTEKGRGLVSGPRGDPPEVTIAGLLEELGWSTVDLVKIDIEGSEFELLRGNAAWLDAVQRIVMEVHGEYGSVSGLADALRERGFQTELTTTRGQRVAFIDTAQGFLFASR